MTESHADESAFIGRRHELAEIRRLLGRTRLLTLTGAGGVGKSRLARRAAEMLSAGYPDGVQVIELAGLEDGDLLESTVASALGLRAAQRPIGAALLDYLADKRMLLVLDNCEHLLFACAALINQMLRHTLRLRILATSRQTIGIYGEQLLRVPSLAVPACDESPRKIARREAVRLFSDRAATVNPDFTVNATNATTLARISARLDGIPLAIELAAARLRTTPIDQLLRELDDRFTTLTGGSTTALPRHQTLRATMDWSHDLCSPAEQHLWARLATFPGGVDLDTAEEICSGDGIAPDEIFDLISGLVDKSVLTTQQVRTATRYRMLESIRAYGREHLTPSEETTLCHARCAHYRRLADANRIDRIVPDQVYRYWLLQTEIANLRVALDSCFTRAHDPGAGLDIASSMWSYWVITGTITEGRHWLDRGLDLTSKSDPVRFTALWADALLAIYQGDVASARSWVAECRALAEQSRDESSLAFALQIAGVFACSAGDPKKGYALLEEARNRHRALGDFDALALNLYLASVYCSATAPHEAAVLGEQLIALCNERGAPLFRSYAQFGVAIAAWIQGDWRHTEAMMRQVAIPWTVINDRWGLVQFLEVMGWTACRRGDHLRAARLLGAADAVWQAVHASPMVVRYSEESHRNCVEHTRQVLGGRAFADAFRSGARLGLDHAIAFALEEEPAVAATAF
ncbi:ATP-binding protein [Actinoallomurus sp. CA-150999]|uniref:ATP-binding protein n=1 Tax=Actinoallomurus sp. CA-150999 TaxID=3239887 RepID=UPI003D94A81F